MTTTKKDEVDRVDDEIDAAEDETDTDDTESRPKSKKSRLSTPVEPELTPPPLPPSL